MWKLNLSPQSKEIVKKLIDSKESEKVGYIAAIDPQTGEVFYGKSVVEAAKEGRKMKNDPKAVFFFVKVGYPSVHVLKSIKLQGYIQNKSLHLASSTPDDIQPLDFIADTGFSGSVVLDTEIIQSIERDYLGEDTVTLAGSVDCSVSVYLSGIIVNSLRLSEVEITETKGEFL